MRQALLVLRQRSPAPDFGHHGRRVAHCLQAHVLDASLEPLQACDALPRLRRVGTIWKLNARWDIRLLRINTVMRLRKRAGIASM